MHRLLQSPVEGDISLSHCFLGDILIPDTGSIEYMDTSARVRSAMVRKAPPHVRACSTRSTQYCTPGSGTSSIPNQPKWHRKYPCGKSAFARISFSSVILDTCIRSSASAPHASIVLAQASYTSGRLLFTPLLYTTFEMPRGATSKMTRATRFHICSANLRRVLPIVVKSGSQQGVSEPCQASFYIIARTDFFGGRETALRRLIPWPMRWLYSCYDADEDGANGKSG